MRSHTGSRVFGLDLLRALAIILVIFSHADDLLDAYWPADPGMAPLDGVDLFFVLSGFLIGGILLRTAEASELPWWRRLVDFWQRRWLRTLPNYFLFLVLNLLMLYFGLSPGLLNVNVLAYFVFLQNVWVPVDLFFWESWSLSVEEWFYLLFPLVLFILVGWFKAVRPAFIIGVLLMIAVPTYLRFDAAEGIATPFMLDIWVRKLVIYRLDTIGYGVLMAWVAHYWPSLLHARRFELFAIGSIGLATAILLRYYTDLNYLGTWFFTFSGLSMAVMLPAFAGWERTGRWGKAVTFMSHISYALYLVHMPLRYLFMPLVADRQLPITVGLYVVFWIASIECAALVFRFWERPFMALRTRLSHRLIPPTTSS